MRDDYEHEEQEYRREHRDGRSGRDDAIVSKDDLNRLGSDAFKESASKLSNAPIGETKKFLGLVTLDVGLVDMLDGVYNLGSNYISEVLRTKSFDIAKKLAPRVGLGGRANTVGTVAAIGTTVAVKTAGYFAPIYEGVSTQLKEQKALARELGPVLDDIKGGHSVASLYGVSIKDNEVVYAHRKRLNRISNTTHLSNAINLGLNSGASLAFDLKGFGTMWGQRDSMTAKGIRSIMTPKPAAADSEEAHVASQDSLGAVKLGILGILPQAAGRLSRTKQHNLMKELQPYSAYQMIKELGEQISGNPDARAFAEPASFQTPHGHRKEYALEEYVMRIFIQHHKDMADISSNHTEIRNALREDLAAVARPIADAIRKGDISAMSLIRMVGEGAIIKKNGRSIAGVDVVKALIKREAPKQAAYANDDPAEYYKYAPFNRSQLKSVLKKLDGEERLALVSMFSDNILMDAGLSKKDVQGYRESAAKTADRMRAELVVGLNAEDKLKTEVLAESEAQRVAEASDALLADGVGAMKTLKTSPTNENGIERLLANAVVNKPEYLGKMLKHGHELMEKAAADDDNMADKPTHSERVSSRLHDKHGAEAGNDEQYLGAANGR